MICYSRAFKYKCIWTTKEFHINNDFEWNLLYIYCATYKGHYRYTCKCSISFSLFDWKPNVNLILYFLPLCHFTWLYFGILNFQPWTPCQPNIIILFYFIYNSNNEGNNSLSKYDLDKVLECDNKA